MLRRKFEYAWKFLRENNCDEVNNIANEMRCIICGKVMINAQSAPCGCRYCLGCVTVYVNGGNRFCPGEWEDCKQELMVIDETVLPDHTMNRRISRLVVKCPQYGCYFTDELGKMEDHERMCEKRTLNCPYCDIGCVENPLSIDRIAEHLEEENESHARLMIDCIGRIQNEVGTVKRDITALELKSREHKRLTDLQTEKIEDLDREIRALLCNHRSTREQINSLQATGETNRAEYVAQSKTVDREMSEMRARGQTQAAEIEQLREKCILIESKLGRLERQAVCEIVGNWLDGIDI